MTTSPAVNVRQETSIQTLLLYRPSVVEQVNKLDLVSRILLCLQKSLENLFPPRALIQLIYSFSFSQSFSISLYLKKYVIWYALNVLLHALAALWHLWNVGLSVEALTLKGFLLIYCDLDCTLFVLHFGQKQLPND